jgi:hypothetical protein
VVKVVRKEMLGKVSGVLIACEDLVLKEGNLTSIQLSCSSS